MSKMTDWFPGNIKPTRKGVYEKLDVKGQNGYQMWNGEFWCFWSSSPNEAKGRDSMSIFQNDPWRGFTEKQNEHQ